MKIGPQTPSFIHHSPPRAVGRRAAEGDNVAPPQATGKPEETGGRKATPPGLERVQARLQALSEPTQGQSNALDRISRNIARYQETQALAGRPSPPPPPPPAPESTSAAPAPASPPPSPAPEAPPPSADAAPPTPTEQAGTTPETPPNPNG